MYSGLKLLINDIYDKTHIEFALFDNVGELIGATSRFCDAFNADITDFDCGIHVDPINENTYFAVESKGMIIYGAVKGNNEEAIKYANLLSALVESNCKSLRMDFSKSEMMFTILNGNATRGEMRGYVDKLSLSASNYFVYAIGTDRATNELLNFLNSLSNAPDDFAILMSKDKIAYIKAFDTVEEYITPSEFAKMIVKNIFEELALDVYVCYGSVAKSVDDFFDSYNQANIGLEMGKKFSADKQIFSYKEFMLINVIDELPKHTKMMFRKKLLSGSIIDILNDYDLRQTAEVFMNHSLNLSETSRALYVHRNTLTYRLDKIERDTGLNIRNFADALTFRLLEILFIMTEKS